MGVVSSSHSWWGENGSTTLYRSEATMLASLLHLPLLDSFSRPRGFIPGLAQWRRGYRPAQRRGA